MLKVKVPLVFLGTQGGTLRVGLKNLQEDIERQRTLVVEERTELRALHRSIEDEQSDRATVERVNQSISRM